MLSALLRELHRRGKRCLVISRDRSVLQGLPYQAIFLLPSFPYKQLNWRWNLPWHVFRYVKPLPPDFRSEAPPRQHIFGEMCAQAGLTGEVELKGEIRLIQKEKRFAQQFQKSVIFQSTCLTAKYPMWTKDWGFEKMQKVVDAVRKHRRVVQIGSAGDPLLIGAEDLRGLSLRKSAAVLAGAELFVGLVGFLMHLARAVATPAVIIYGGREKPWQSGYAEYENLVSDVPCSPCWRYDNCESQKKCMEIIYPEIVIEKVIQILSRPKKILVARKVSIHTPTF